MACTIKELLESKGYETRYLKKAIADRYIIKQTNEFSLKFNKHARRICLLGLNSLYRKFGGK